MINRQGRPKTSGKVKTGPLVPQTDVDYDLQLEQGYAAAWSGNTGISHDTDQFQPPHLTVTGGVSQLAQRTGNDWLTPDFQYAIEAPDSPTSIVYELPIFAFDGSDMPAEMEENKPMPKYNPFEIGALWESDREWVQSLSARKRKRSIENSDFADYEEGTFDFDALNRRLTAQLAPSKRVIRNVDDHMDPKTMQNTPHGSRQSSARIEALDWTNFVLPSGGDYLGGGGFADVYRVQWTGMSTDESQTIPPVAMKKFRITESKLTDKKLQKKVKREIQVCSVVKHENIVPFVGVCQFPNEFPYLLSEYMMNGPVNKYIEKHPRTCLHAIMLGIAKGLKYLHDKDIIHGDIKGENILINRRGKPCLCDFGLSKILSDSTLWKSSAAQAGGTLRWQAPELMAAVQRETTKESDVYSYGVSCYEIMTNRVPFYECKVDCEVLMNVAIHKKTLQRPTNCPWLTNFIWELLTRCWTFDPSERPSVSDVLDHLSPHACHRTKTNSACLFRKGNDNMTKHQKH